MICSQKSGDGNYWQNKTQYVCLTYFWLPYYIDWFRFLAEADSFSRTPIRPFIFGETMYVKIWQ